MVKLPKERVTPNHPPFYFTGVDYFGPFYVKQGRSSVKYYGCLFTYLTMRAVHIKHASDLSTSAFINALQRFFGRRGKPRKIISDNGTNFVGADKELRKAMSDLEDNKINAELRQRYIEWQFNPSYASHMGGVWERLTRSIRKILRSLLTHQTVSYDVFQTLVIEVEAILNARPLTPILMDFDVNVPLTPNHLLLLRPSASCFPCEFTKSENYRSRRWRQV